MAKEQQAAAAAAKEQRGEDSHAVLYLFFLG